MNGIELIAEERKRQMEVEGYSIEHDLLHKEGEFLDAAACYMLPNARRPTEDVTEVEFVPPYAVIYDQTDERGRIHKIRVMPPNNWPWHANSWKPTPFDRVRELVKAGALIAAAIDRIINKQNKSV